MITIALPKMEREKYYAEGHLPCFSILALPMGMTKSGESASSDIGKELPYIISFSSKMTGLSSLTAALSKPLASSLDHGDKT